MRAGDDDVVPLHTPFEVSFRGFRPRQVLEHIESLEGQLAMVGADRDDALEQAAGLRKLLEHLRVEREEMQARLERLEAEPGSVGGTSERLHRMMVLADAETNELRRRVAAEVDAQRRRAESDVAALRRRAAAEAKDIRLAAEQEAAESRAACAQAAADLELQRTRLMSEQSDRLRRFEQEQRTRREQTAEEYRTTVAKAEAEATRLQRETEEACARAEAASQARTTQQEQALARHREQTVRELTEREELSRERSNALLHLVAHETQRRIEEATHTLGELQGAWDTLATRLRSTRSALDKAVAEAQTPTQSERRLRPSPAHAKADPEPSEATDEAATEPRPAAAFARL